MNIFEYNMEKALHEQKEGAKLFECYDTFERDMEYLDEEATEELRGHVAEVYALAKIILEKYIWILNILKSRYGADVAESVRQEADSNYGVYNVFNGLSFGLSEEKKNELLSHLQ